MFYYCTISNEHKLLTGRHSGVVVSAVAPKQEGPGFEDSLPVSAGTLASSNHNEDTYVGLFGDSKLLKGVNVYLSLYVGQ